MSTAGLLLAAGAGRRMGRPKALVDDWLVRGVTALSPCDSVSVVLGAGAEQARSLLSQVPEVRVVVCADWADGMGASLAAGLGSLTDADDTRCLVTLVDLPDVGAEVCRRVLAAPDRPDVLARAAYDGRPRHPVLLGRDHWAGVLAASVGDRGARDYLADRDVIAVECGDLATGQDVDSR